MKCSLGSSPTSAPVGAFIYIPHGYKNDGTEDFCDERKTSCPLIYVSIAQLFTEVQKWNMKQMRVVELGQALCVICWAINIRLVPAFKHFSIESSSLILFLYSFKSIGFYCLPDTHSPLNYFMDIEKHCYSMQSWDENGRKWRLQKEWHLVFLTEKRHFIEYDISLAFVTFVFRWAL